MSAFVIIGGGIAGTTAAETIRKRDSKADIIIIGSEVHPVYSRVLLPNYVEGKTEREKIFLKKPEWYIDNNIVYMSGIDVLEVDTKNKFVRTSEDREIPYDKLLITTGGETRLANYDMRGVSYFRTVEDADLMIDFIKTALSRPKKDRHAIVQGGGFVALEYIKIFTHFNIPTTVVLRSNGFWSKSLGEHSQKVLETYVKARGVTVLKNKKLVEFIGKDDFEGVKFEDGTEIAAQIIGVGIGMVPEMGFLKDSGVEMNKGILVNEYLETNVEDVYSAGDVTEFYDCIVDRQFVLGNWMNAQMQARAAATSMTGEKTKFELVSSYSTNLLGKEIVFIGDASREHADKIIQETADEENSTEIFVRNGKIVGAVLMGDVKERTKLTQAIKDREIYSEKV